MARPLTHPVPTRIAPYDGPLSEGSAALVGSLARGERPLNIFQTLAHHPRLLKHVVGLGGALLVGGNLPARSRELIILRVGVRTDAEYEYAQHLVIGAQAGLTDEEMRSVATEDAAGLGEDDRLLVAMVDELCADDVVGDSTWAALAARYEPRDLVELLVLVGYYRMIAGFLNSAGVQIDAGLEGWPQP